MDVIKSVQIMLGGENIFRPEAKASVLECLDFVPEVDAVEVVRCKDCVHYRPWLYGDKICGRLESYYDKKQPDDYCSRGRKHK